ncbi:MAG: ATP synthase F1 subunit delta [Spirochaetales bacterium]|jgi:F-type H+-transporting ATPase subunit delta|nr:ATP synthase F1 subunit delta [Spirochaetales bacterium]
MFAAGRWARAFLAACADKKEEGLAVLKAFESCAPAAFWGSGSGAAERLGRILSGAAGGRAGESGAGFEAARRTLMLLVRKGGARYLPALVREAQAAWDAENGIWTFVLESAFPPDEEFTQTLRKALQEKTAARQIRLNVRLMPELIGGCRLRIGTQLLDASVNGQLHRMAADLHAAGGFSEAFHGKF